MQVPSVYPLYHVHIHTFVETGDGLSSVTDSSQDPIEFTCALSQQLMEDPVCILDEPRHTYERRFIQDWFQACRARNRQPTSPMTRRVVSESLVENLELRSRMFRDWHQSALLIPQTKSILSLREVFAQLDPLRDILSQTLNGWQPPQVVVIGQEGTGKSSILERLAMMSLFPRAEGICTRVPIHVRLRNAEVAQAPSLEVFNVATNTSEEGPHTLPLEWGAVEVSEKMDEILQREHGRRTGVSMERIIIVRVEGPLVPSIDLVDLPGLVALPREQEAQTRALVERHVAEHGACSIYLVAVPASDDPRNSTAMTLVERLGLQDRTLGVFTMCDEVQQRRLPALRRYLGIDPRPQADDDAGGSEQVLLEANGWVATSNRPAEQRAGDTATRGQRLRAQASAEEAILEAKLPGAVAAGQASCGALVRRLNTLFLRYLRTTWLPATLNRLREAEQAVEERAGDLGLPAITSVADRALGRRLACSTAREAIERQADKLMRECCAEVLEPLRQRLTGSVPVSRTAPARAVRVVLSAERAEVDAACRAAAATWSERWLAGLRQVLVEEPPPPRQLAGALRRRRADYEEDGGAGFRLRRFPSFVEAVERRAADLLEGGKEAMLAGAARCADAFYACGSPHVRVKTRLEADQATVELERDVAALSEGVALPFLLYGDPVEPLTGALEGVAGAVEDWVETCAAERGQLARRSELLVRAREGIIRLTLLQAVVLEHLKKVFSVDWSPDGRQLAVADQGTVALWDPVVGSRLETLCIGGNHYCSAAFYSPDGTLLACCCMNDLVIFSLASRSVLNCLNRPSFVRSVSWRPNQQQLLYCQGDSLHLWTLESGSVTVLEAQAGQEGTDNVLTAAYNFNGNLFAVARSSCLQVFDSGTVSRVAVLNVRNCFEGVAWRQDSLLLAAGDGATIWLWNCLTWVVSARVSMDGIRSSSSLFRKSLAFSPDGRLLAKLTANGAVLLDVQSRSRVASLEGHSQSAQCLAFSPDSTLLATGSEDLTVRVWPVPPPALETSQSRGSGAADGAATARAVRRRVG